MSLIKELRPTLPILIGAAIMLSLSGGIRQSFGLIMPPLTRDIAVSVSDFALAMSVQNLAWGFLQPVAGAHQRLVYCTSHDELAGQDVHRGGHGLPQSTRGRDADETVDG